MIAKTLIWMMAVAFLFLSCGLSFAAFSVGRKFDELASRNRYGQPRDAEDERIFVHDTYFVLGSGPIELRVYPHVWATILIFIGAVAMVVGLVFILHVPQVHSN